MRTNYANLNNLRIGGTKGAVNTNLEKELQKIITFFQAIYVEFNKDKKNYPTRK